MTPTPPPSTPVATAMVFDGQNSLVVLDQPLPALPAGVTVEFWAKGGDDLPRKTSVFASWKADGARILNIHLPWDDGVVYWDAGGVDGYDNIRKTADAGEYKGSWAHWAFVKDVAKQEMSIYRNGALWQRVGGKARPLAEGGHANIGAFVNGAHKWSGRLAEFRIWDRARTEEEVRADRGRRLTGKEPGLVGYWPLDRIDANGTTPDLTSRRPGAVRGATTAPDDALVTALAVGAGQRPSGVSPVAPEYVVSWANMTSGFQDYARWQEMFAGRSGRNDPPFRRGRIWA
jgi:cyanobactin cluster PatC/TenC/TruC protein